MKKSLVVFTVILLVSCFSACGKSDNNVSVNQQTNSKQNEKESKGIFLVKKDEASNVLAEKDQNNSISGDLLDFNVFNCNEDNLVKIKVDENLTPKEILEKLFSYEDYDKQKMYNFFNSTKEITIKDLILKNDFAILKLSETLILNGDDKINGVKNVISRCLGEQIRATLKQFDDIEGVDIFVGEDVTLDMYGNQ